MADVAFSYRHLPTNGRIEVFNWYVNGNEVAEVKAEFPVHFYGHIVDGIVDAGTAPSGSTSIVDVHLNGTTIYTTQGNRPTLPADDTGLYAEAGEPEVTALVPGDTLLIEVDQIGSGTAATRVMYSIVCQMH